MGEWSYFYTFFQSNLLELPVFYFIYRSVQKASWSKAILVTSFSNSITHPVVFFGFMASGLSYLISVLLAEAFAILTEAFLHWRFGRLPFSQALHASVIANFVSWQFAPLLTYLVFWA